MRVHRKLNFIILFWHRHHWTNPWCQALYWLIWIISIQVPWPFSSTCHRGWTECAWLAELPRVHWDSHLTWPDSLLACPLHQTLLCILTWSPPCTAAHKPEHLTSTLLVAVQFLFQAVLLLYHQWQQIQLELHSQLLLSMLKMSPTFI